MTHPVYVAGVGMTRFGKFYDRTIRSLGREAAVDALSDAGLRPRDVNILVSGTARTGMYQGRESGVGQLIGWEIGIRGIPVHNVKNYCASGASAFNLAWLAVASGEFDVALAIGVEKLTSRNGKGRPLTSDGMEIEGDLGFTPPAFYAMVASRHMKQYGTTREQIAAVAVKNRHASQFNPRAQYRETATIEQVLSARPVVSPLTLFDCCPTGDGAAAAVLISDRMARRLGQERLVRVAASVLNTGLYESIKDITTFELDAQAGRNAYTKAAIGPLDVDVAEVHDAFTIAEIVHYEDLGFCEKGDGGSLVERGVTAIGGRMPVNPSGGLLTKGHPLGATGLAQVYELVTQIRGEAGQRQVERARVGLAQVAGGFLEGDFATSSVIILER